MDKWKAMEFLDGTMAKYMKANLIKDSYMELELCIILMGKW